MNIVSILDYGLGNVNSVLRMVEKVGGTAVKIVTPEEVQHAEKIILPGVGHFDHGMHLLQEKGLVNALKAFASQQQTTLLGICLGMQLLFDSSEEGSTAGLGLIPGKVVKIKRTNEHLHVPQMGWNEVDVCKANLLIPNYIEQGIKPRFYFVHSYHAICEYSVDVLATVHYGANITAAVSRRNIYATQFHPEKSHRFGMDMIKRFVEL